MTKTFKVLSLVGAFLLSGSAIAAAADMVVTSGGWTGPYIGLNVGYGGNTWSNWTEYDGRTDPLDDAGNRKSVSGSSLVGGAQFGYNWQKNNIVWGVEGDFQLSGMHSDEQGGWTFDSCGCFDVSMNDFATLRARVGIAASDTAMFYVTGGGILGNLKYSYSDGPVGSATNTSFGWTAGVGAEAKLSEKVSVKVEGLYYSFGSPHFNMGDVDFDTNIDVHGYVARVGLNYHF